MLDVNEKCPRCQNRRFNIIGNGNPTPKKILGYSPGVEKVLKSITSEPEYLKNKLAVEDRGKLFPDQWSGALFKRVNERLGGRLFSDDYMAVGLGYDPFEPFDNRSYSVSMVCLWDYSLSPLVRF